mmetsp:Transcript_9710/g.11654  ORF Transcript_9710/g.11654 Transcript_9710/m.11654 type:complete len:203 (-) Transcript_9710:63-671(-)
MVYSTKHHQSNLGSPCNVKHRSLTYRACTSNLSCLFSASEKDNQKKLIVLPFKLSRTFYKEEIHKMPKNKGKGGKNRRRGKNENEEKRELIFKEDGQEYAQVMRMLGNGRLEAFCFDGTKRLCHIRGKMRKKVWVACGDIILVGLRDYQDSKADVILKYNPDEARNLKAYKEIPDSAKINEGAVNEDDDAAEDECAFTFDEI